MARRKLRNKTGFTYIVFFSGGMGSWAALMCTVEQARPVDTIIALFTDTKALGDTHPHRGEDPDTYRFMKEVQAKLSDRVKFLDIADGRDIWQVFTDVRYMGNTRRDPCSAKLKRELAHAIVERFDPNTTILVIGIDWQELQRIPDNVEAWKPYIVRFPMCEKPLMTKKQIIEWCRTWGVEPPQLYEFGFDHNNCGGFCVKAGLGQFYKLWLRLYERYRLTLLIWRIPVGVDALVIRRSNGRQAQLQRSFSRGDVVCTQAAKMFALLRNGGTIK